jgi:antibiotic biosynthesis monooxygenase (ABM) superfamily enzyme
VIAHFRRGRPATAAWPLALKMLVMSILMVSTLTWLLMPTLTRLLRPSACPTSVTHAAA